MSLWPAWYTPHGKQMPAPLLIEYVAHQLKTTSDELKGRGRTVRYCHGRAVIIHTLRRRGHSTLVIGRILGRDHSSICNAIRMIPVYHRAPGFSELLERTVMVAL
jgi:chromosomal replication initiation ATPase DnaA